MNSQLYARYMLDEGGTFERATARDGQGLFETLYMN